MIVATIQGKDDGRHITAINGKLVKGDEQQNAIDVLYSKISKINLGNKNFGIKQINSHELFCYMEHPEKDIYGRKRIAYIVFDKNEDSNLIEKTINEMGLNYNTFNELYTKFLNDKKMLMCIGIGIGVAVLVSATVFIIYDSNLR
ncbi:hypothetical protein [Brachyspira intermedia]|uniref:hypothetical protein n=1 Tax=Brachyspira intermedia TaxID=84377 RepID=UPI0030074866